jgi:putative ABC transport system permease protein
MIKNYFKIAWRSLKSKPLFTILNIVGLTIGAAGVMLIGLYIHDELSFDKSYTDTDQIYRVNVDLKFGDYVKDLATAPAVLGPTLAQDYEEVEVVTRFRRWGGMLVKRPEAEENLKVENTTYVDPSFLEMFDFKLLQGNPETCLTEPNTVVLTESIARDHFGNENAVGESIIFDNENIFRITGVVQDMPQKSFLREFGIFMSMSTHEASENPLWSNYNFPTFVKLNEMVSEAKFAPKLQAIFDNYNLPAAQKNDPTATKASFEKSGNYIRYSLLPIADLHLSSNRVAELSPNNDKQDVYILSAIGLFLIVLACINFINLSTAQSLKRAKEVGIRKTLGSTKGSLISQFLAESVLVSFGAVLVAIFVVFMLFAPFNELAAKQLELPFTSVAFWLTVLGSALLLGILAGVYPAFFMTRFQPVKVLKGRDSKARGGSVRSSLVVFQFTISIFLIISTLVVYQQLNYMQNKTLGYEKDQLLIINNAYSLGTKSQSFKNKIKTLNGVEQVTFSGFLPTPSNRSDSGFELLGTNEQDRDVQMQCWRVEHDYVETLELNMAAGRDFDEKFASDSTGIILNERAVSLFNLNPEEALGMKIRKGDEEDSPPFTVIGVVKDFHFESFKSGIEPLSFIQEENLGSMVVKLKAGDFKSTIAQIEQEWTATVVGEPFSYQFMEETFEYNFKAEQRLGQIFMVFAMLSILIACLGLFGLAAFNAEKRTKEIGIRKVMGASVSQLAGLLTYDFLKLVAVSILIAAPLGWYIMNSWLSDFTYRIDISATVFIIAASVAVLISVLTVSYQALKAAVVNPVESLKGE